MEAGTCLRCGAPYEEGATVCFTCGASIGEVETPTQPVRVPKVKPADAATPAADAAPAATPTPPPVAAKPPAPVAEKPTRRRRWPLVVALVLVLAAGGTGIGLALRASLAAPPVATTATYRDPQGRFSLTRPALWTAQEMPEGVTLSDSSGASTARIAVRLPAPATPSATAAVSPQAALTAAADEAAREAGLTVPPRPATPGSLSGATLTRTVAGETWELREGRATGADGVVRQVSVLVTLHGGALYSIQLSSPISAYEQTNTLVYTPLLASFAFA